MIDNSIYREDIKYVAGLDLPWEKLSNKSILITGASGLIGSFLIDVLMDIIAWIELQGICIGTES